MTENAEQKTTEQKVPWYQSNATIIISLLTIGPFALPLVWFNPRYSMKVKVLATIALAVLTYFLGAATISAFKMAKEAFQQLNQCGL